MALSRTGAMLIARAAQMIAYIELTNLLSDFPETIAILRNHRFESVRVFAIDAYLYANSDSEQAKQTVRSLVRETDKKFIGLGRFVGNRDPAERDKFNQTVAAWQAANPSEMPPARPLLGPHALRNRQRYRRMLLATAPLS